jgi:hypothetical protein
MNDAKHIGLDVHQATISVAVLDSAGQLVMEAILETKAERFSSLSMVCGAACTYPLRKGPGRPGCTIYSSRMLHKCLSVTRARTTWGKSAIRTIATMHARAGRVFVPQQV